jgi:hypothetical protein
MISKRLYFVIILLGYGSAQAQFNKGDKMVGSTLGTVLFNSGNTESTVSQVGTTTAKKASYQVTISPSMGWFLSSATAAGASLLINPSGEKTTYEENGSTFQKDKINSFNIGLGGFVRHYLGSKTNLLPFVHAGLNAGISNLKTEGFFYYRPGGLIYKYTYDGKSSGGFFLNAVFQGGFTKMLSENTGLDFYIGYNYSYNKNDFSKTTLVYFDNTDTVPDETDKNETENKTTTHGFVLGVGFQVFLKKKK